MILYAVALEYARDSYDQQEDKVMTVEQKEVKRQYIVDGGSSDYRIRAIGGVEKHDNAETHYLTPDIVLRLYREMMEKTTGPNWAPPAGVDNSEEGNRRLLPVHGVLGRRNVHVREGIGTPVPSRRRMVRRGRSDGR